MTNFHKIQLQNSKTKRIAEDIKVEAVESFNENESNNSFTSNKDQLEINSS